MSEIKTNVLFYGDNLQVLRDHFPDGCIDLIYLDPPFKSQRDYNIFFTDKAGQESQAQIKAFEDTWRWTPEVELTFQELVTQGRNQTLIDLVQAFRSFMAESDLMAYLTMMAIRLQELHRVLKATGSLYLHCDPTASHYLKVLMDAVFGGQGFKGEIAWKRTSAHSDTKQGSKQPGRIHDIIFFCTKGKEWVWNPVYTEYDQSYIDTFYRHTEPETGRRYRLSDLTGAKPGGDTLYEWKGVRPYKGRYWAYSKEKMEQFEREGRLVYTKSGMPQYKRYLDEMPGIPLQDLWVDIKPPSSKERLQYPTQKPLTLLERIIQASSNEGDVVLDPFCGCGTAVVAAHKLKRRWLGIDITHLATSLMKGRLEASFPELKGKIEVVGIPRDLGGAQHLAQQDRHEFQYWVCTLLGALPPSGSPKKGADKGVDGIVNFFDLTGQARRIIVSVKSGTVHVKDIRELIQVVDKQKAAIGVLATLEPPTGPMETEAVGAGFFEAGGGVLCPKIQILTVEELLAGKRPKYPTQVGGVANISIKQAQKVTGKGQGALEL